jgi:hypothetical protein
MDYDIDTQTPVVESFLQEGTNSLTVKVYSMEAYLTDEVDVSEPLGGLTLKVNDKILTEATKGTYTLDLGEDTIRENQVFHLLFDYNGKTIEGSTTVPAPVQNLRVAPQSLEYSAWTFWDDSDTSGVLVSWDDPDGSYYQLYIESPNTSDMPSMGIFGHRMLQPFKGNSYQVAAREFRSVGSHWIYVYRIDKDYAELYERISSTDLANPVSFVTNAFGIFTSMSMGRVGVRVYEAED